MYDDEMRRLDNAGKYEDGPPYEGTGIEWCGECEDFVFADFQSVKDRKAGTRRFNPHYNVKAGEDCYNTGAPVGM